MTDAKVAEAARRWVLARERARKLREKRAMYECQHETMGEPDVSATGDGFVMVGGADPCWKNRDGVFPIDSRIDGLDYCESCRERDVVQADYRKATASRGSAERVLIRFAKAQIGGSSA